MAWYRVNLSAPDVSGPSSLQDQFANIFITLGGPRDAGMFGGLDLNSFLYYFSPGATRIAGALIARYAGVECVPPKRSEVIILVADAGLNEISFSPEA